MMLLALVRIAVSMTLVSVVLGQNTTSPSPSGTNTTSPSPSPTVKSDNSSSSSDCFPGDAVVVMADGSLKGMSELEIGDWVSDGRGGSSPVFLFGHRDARREGNFVQVEAAVDGVEYVMQLSPGHFLPVGGRLLAARLVKVGDHVELLKDGLLANGVVTGIQAIRKVGLYNPHTLGGSIVVNGMMASCYTETVHPSLAHVLLTPFRLVYPVARGGLGILTGPFNWAGAQLHLRDGKLAFIS
eukprot:CAMPEP_0184681234 /NCGR_PEP_ID=MMETSP0312-20130426/4191_1 /TAXON_ID=31354 /ORGANISM="Compsopogon coeruleus, Strain SAG 36.94" /LENGTH=240 /DNA_ID=CAMNT_0027131921 /DNA_START=180 /DNA_END=902 /DNA_ORIENTATION=+